MTEIYTLPELPYSVDALEPHYSAEALGLHHDKHHAAYVKKANEILDQLATSKPDALPPGILRSLAFNVAGHRLHSLFWECMTPDGGGAPGDDLAGELTKVFGSVDDFKQHFEHAALGVEGSGWAALVREPISGGLQIAQIHDHHQDLVPESNILLLLDVWEHAYYIDHRNVRADWVTAFWELVDWKAVEGRLVQ